jgi:hypothetical protein
MCHVTKIQIKIVLKTMEDKNKVDTKEKEITSTDRMAIVEKIFG